ncbi:MAG: MopE-related protein, partial [Myxococcota bacterium]|nr:MopE-related protein [Myxococcota bacterium]
ETEIEADCDDLDASLNHNDGDGDGYSSCAADCDDSNADIYPGAAEKDDLYACMKDSDGDGYGDPNDIGVYAIGIDCDDSDASLNQNDFDSDGYSTCDGDCLDVDPYVYIGAAYFEDLTACTIDVDGDGYGSTSVISGSQPGIDCDDTNAELNQNDMDLDGESTCDGDCDDSDPGLYSSDFDGDGYSACDGDCNDASNYIYPGAAYKDSLSDCLQDMDGDGYGDANYDTPGRDCDDSDPMMNYDDYDNDGYSSCEDDCNDLSPSIFPGAAQFEFPVSCAQDQDDDGYAPVSQGGTDCNDLDASVNQFQSDLVGDGIDQNCDGIDGEDADGDGDPSLSSGGLDCNDGDVAYHGLDLDGDGYSICDGDCNDQNVNFSLADNDGDGYTTCGGDCDDSTAFAFPGAAENESLTACMLDEDEDGYGSDAAPVAGSDCDDSDPFVNPIDTDNDGFSICDGDCNDNSAIVVPQYINGDWVCYSPEASFLPSQLSFDDELGCSSTQLITLYNTGNTDLTIDQLEINNTTDYSLDLYESFNGSLPWSLPAETGLPVFLTYSPQSSGTNDTSIVVTSDTPNQPTKMMNIYAETNVETIVSAPFIYGSPSQLDLLFFLDRSSASTAYVNDVVAVIPDFLSRLKALSIDFRFALIGTDSGCVGGSTLFIDSSIDPTLYSSLLSSMLSPNQTDVTANTMEQTEKTVQKLATNECNEGLLRPDASWHFIGVSAGEDLSSGVSSDYLDALYLEKGDFNITIHGLYSLTGCGTNNPFLLGAVLDSSGEVLDICSSDLASVLENHIYDIVQTDVLLLPSEPIVSSMSLSIDGVSFLQGVGWDYDSSLQQVVFDPVPPNEGSLVDVIYTEQRPCTP